jgi:hypothetical protein
MGVPSKIFSQRSDLRFSTNDNLFVRYQGRPRSRGHRTRLRRDSSTALPPAFGSCEAREPEGGRAVPLVEGEHLMRGRRRSASPGRLRETRTGLCRDQPRTPLTGPSAASGALGGPGLPSPTPIPARVAVGVSLPCHGGQPRALLCARLGLPAVVLVLLLSCRFNTTKQMPAVGQWRAFAFLRRVVGIPGPTSESGVSRANRTRQGEERP